MCEDDLEVEEYWIYPYPHSGTWDALFIACVRRTYVLCYANYGLVAHMYYSFHPYMTRGPTMYFCEGRSFRLTNCSKES